MVGEVQGFVGGEEGIGGGNREDVGKVREGDFEVAKTDRTENSNL